MKFWRQYNPSSTRTDWSALLFIDPGDETDSGVLETCARAATSNVWSSKTIAAIAQLRMPRHLRFCIPETGAKRTFTAHLLFPFNRKVEDKDKRDNMKTHDSVTRVSSEERELNRLSQVENKHESSPLPHRSYQVIMINSDCCVRWSAVELGQ